MKLSQRLQAIERLIPDQAVLVDVGCDHGLLMVDCLKSGKCRYVYGIDIASKPLKHAYDNLKRHNLLEQSTLLEENGLQNFQASADTYVIAGMGGETIWDILKNYSFSETDTLIIQANTKVTWLRSILNQHHFEFVEEVFLLERDIPVFIMKVRKVSRVERLTLEDYIVGPLLKQKPTLPYLSYLEKRVHYLESLPRQSQSFTEELNCIKAYLTEKGVLS